MFVDLQAAYDNVRHEKLMEILRGEAKVSKNPQIAMMVV